MQDAKDSVHIVAYQVAESLNLKKIRQHLKNEPISLSNYDLYYKLDAGYIYILNYGIVVFAEVPEDSKKNYLERLKPFATDVLSEPFVEDFIIQIKPDEKISFTYNSLVVPEINEGILRIAMLQVAQSSALDFYREKAQEMFNETQLIARELKELGRLKTSKKKILQFIGNTIITKNKIIDDLYVIDTPLAVWENEQYGTIHDGLSATLDIKTRFKEVDYILKSVEGSLSVFIELIDARENKLLEIIIVGLIFFEILHTMFTQFFT